MMTGEELQMCSLSNKPPVQETSEFAAEEGKSRNMKKPRKVLHFSDGTLEEYSTEDEQEEEESKPDSSTVVDPKSLNWGPWMYHMMWYSSSSMLSACDYVGEGLANFLGITSPKYQYEIDEYKRTMEEEEKLKKEEEAEMAGWTTTEGASDTVSMPLTTNQPPSPAHNGPQNVGVTEPSSPGAKESSQTPEDTLLPQAISQPPDTEPNSAEWNRF